MFRHYACIVWTAGYELHLSYDFKVARGAFGELLQTALQPLLRGGLHFGELDAIAQCWIQGSYDSLGLGVSLRQRDANVNLGPYRQRKQQFHVATLQADVCCFPGSGIGLSRAMQLHREGTMAAPKPPVLRDVVLHACLNNPPSLPPQGRQVTIPRLCLTPGVGKAMRGNRLCTETGKDGVFRIRREIAVDQRFVGSQLPPAGQAGISVQADVRTDRSRVRLAGAFFPGYWIFRVLPSCLTKPFLWFWRLTSSLEYVLAARRMPFAALAASTELPRYSAELK